MRVATKLAIALSTIALCTKLRAQQTAVIISLIEQTARDLAAEFFARVKIGTPVKVIGGARNVTRVRRAIPTVQPGNSRYATAFYDSAQVSGSARNLAQVRRALPVVQPGRSRARNGVLY